MIEDDFNNLLTAVAEAFDVPKGEICRKYSHRTTKPRDFICHLIQHGHVHLRNTFIKWADISRVAFYKGVDIADEAIHDYADDLCLMNEIRAKVDLPKLKRSVRHNVSNTKVLFGFDYTELDALRLLNACRGAKEYMQKLCSIGRKPIPDGMVFSPLRPKRTYNSWYND